jgi:hypothetical protein
MLDRDKIVAVLKKRFPTAPTGEIAAAVNAIVGLDDEWEEIPLADVTPCRRFCYLARAIEDGVRLKLLRCGRNQDT